MAWTVKMKDNSIHSEDFRSLNMKEINILSSNTVNNLEIDMNNGNVFINKELITRTQVMNHYNKGPYKPIQFRKVVNIIGMYDWGTLESEMKDIESPTSKHVLSLISKMKDNTITEQEMMNLAECAGKHTNSIPFKEFEVQTIGYSYNFNNKKVQIEFTLDPEIQAIMMTQNVTDLISETKEVPYRIRLI